MPTLTEGKCQICGAGWWSVNTVGVDATANGFICSAHPDEEKKAAHEKAGKEAEAEWDAAYPKQTDY